MGQALAHTLSDARHTIGGVRIVFFQRLHYSSVQINVKSLRAGK